MQLKFLLKFSRCFGSFPRTSCRLSANLAGWLRRTIKRLAVRRRFNSHSPFQLKLAAPIVQNSLREIVECYTGLSVLEPSPEDEEKTRPASSPREAGSRRLEALRERWESVYTHASDSVDGNRPHSFLKRLTIRYNLLPIPRNL